MAAKVILKIWIFQQIVCVLALLSVASAVPIPWKDCGSHEHLHLASATASVWPPKLGQPVDVGVSGNLDETVTGGNYQLQVWFDYIPLVNQIGTLASVNISIIPAGSFNITKTVNVPALPLGGYIKVQLSVTDQNGDDVLCFSVDASVNAGKDAYLSDEFIDEINAKAMTWRAGRNTYHHRWTVPQIKSSMGAKRDPARRARVNARFSPHPLSVIDSLPKEFDPRVAPGAPTSCTGPILDQGMCGSCWAFGAAETVSDRLCLKSSNHQFIQLAPLDLVTCDQNDNGCEGGWPESALQYAEQSGLVTEGCLPYLTSEGGPIPTCPPSSEPCLNFVNTPNCIPTCANNATYSRDKHFVTTVYGVSTVAQIRAELVQNGPVEASFTVYADFLNYKSGVYQYTSGAALGGHAVKMIGYGTDRASGLPYWLCSNSWTTTWGANGFFKILAGSDECGIEDDVVTASF